ncbi:hypothetical protein J31TS4_30690 [Paenibacillus sp. J31TS4]|uniref:YugN family protein n=1 Tax=Paenibacillus sp. J31TS4 TaxID=2807195 RepID=UPI001B04B5A9|nr:YugN family protein [Paenibacillus sp. J31TS4]GIP39789.1 hypothetical protein J31TS4_30690 [Paenibacillus sp. J31TS4]
MLITNSGLTGMQADLATLDEVAEKTGFVRWQWEYYRATYDYKIEDAGNEYYLRINARAEVGKLESPHAILKLEDTYMGKATFPHGLDYESPIPQKIQQQASQKLQEFKNLLSQQ